MQSTVLQCGKYVNDDMPARCIAHPVGVKGYRATLHTKAHVGRNHEPYIQGPLTPIP